MYIFGFMYFSTRPTLGEEPPERVGASLLLFSDEKVAIS